MRYRARHFKSRKWATFSPPVFRPISTCILDREGQSHRLRHGEEGGKPRIAAWRECAIEGRKGGGRAFLGARFLAISAPAPPFFLAPFFPGLHASGPGEWFRRFFRPPKRLPTPFSVFDGRPGFRGRRIRATARSRCVTKLTLPNGQPVRPCSRKSRSSSSGIALSKKPRQGHQTAALWSDRPTWLNRRGRASHLDDQVSPRLPAARAVSTRSVRKRTLGGGRMVQPIPAAHVAWRQNTARSVFRCVSRQSSPAVRAALALGTRLALCQAVGTCSGQPRREANLGSQLPRRPQAPAHRHAETSCLSRAKALAWRLRSRCAPAERMHPISNRIVKQHYAAPSANGRNTIISISKRPHCAAFSPPVPRL